MNINRVIVIVLDSVGIGELPDAADFGDGVCDVQQVKPGLVRHGQRRTKLGGMI